MGREQLIYNELDGMRVVQWRQELAAKMAPAQIAEAQAAAEGILRASIKTGDTSEGAQVEGGVR